MLTQTGYCIMLFQLRAKGSRGHFMLYFGWVSALDRLWKVTPRSALSESASWHSMSKFLDRAFGFRLGFLSFQEFRIEE